jgi:hypothetical protein
VNFCQKPSLRGRKQKIPYPKGSLGFLACVPVRFPGAGEITRLAVVAGLQKERTTIMTTQKAQTAPKAPPPVARIQVLRVQGAIWRKGTDRTWHEVSFKRGFKRQDGSYGNSHSYDLASALALHAALAEAIPMLRSLDAAARTPAPEPEVDDDSPYIEDEVAF